MSDFASQIDHALALIAGAEVGSQRAARRARQKLARWRAESAENEAATLEAERRWHLMGQMASSLREQFGQPAALASKPSGKLQRRALLSLGAAGVGMGLLAWRFYPQSDAPQFAKNYRTDKARLLKIGLPDGSQIHLNAQTELSVALYPGRRSVHISNGEARFDVPHNTGRPFVVQTPSGTVEVVGTVFSVAERAGVMKVTVERGHVRVRPSGPSSSAAGDTGNAIDLLAGDAVDVREGTASAVHRIDVHDAAAWRSGWLVFDNTRLDEALPAINAFLQKPLQLDSSASALRLTGRFRANDPQGLLAALPAVLPVKITTTAEGGQLISGVSAR